ncbi:MAG: class I SAM-dependent methyltransferase [Candidatus Heimdallarchaeota archaeon]|nr:class I SAM-dependent methyltransferase [Candidatus Heimdallarchaeota archaeon]
MSDLDFELIEAYKKISPRYSNLKKKPWKDFQIYLGSIRKRFPLPTEGILLDIGSGNARNLLLFESQNWQHIASDISFELLDSRVTLENNTVYPLNNNANSIPLKEGSVDLSLCIATIHHFRNEDEVLLVLRNISKILKQEGFLILSCWKKWKKGTRKKIVSDFLLYFFKKSKNRLWRHGDIYLPWYNEKKELIAERYYHLFGKKELLKIVSATNYTVIDFAKLGGRGGKDNFFLLLKNE